MRSVGTAVSPTAPAAGEAEEGVVVNQDYSDRPGYDPNFLDSLKVPLPAISSAMEQDTATVQPNARKNGDPFELAYYHYSVYMNKRRRTAWFSAANIDGDRRHLDDTKTAPRFRWISVCVPCCSMINCGYWSYS